MENCFLHSMHTHTFNSGLVMKNLNAHPSTTTPPPPLEEVDEDSGLLEIVDETDGVMEGMQYEDGEVDGDGDGEGEGEGEWFIDSRLLQKDFIAKQYSLALFTFSKVGCSLQLEAGPLLRKSRPSDNTIILILRCIINVHVGRNIHS
jgi:hypothetical protein